MKTLKEHIAKNTTLYNNYENDYKNNYENYLLEKLCTHCSLEFKWENSLDPRFSFYKSIYESLGKFDNAGKVVEHICNELKNNFNSQKIDCQDDHVYFKYIDIDLHKDGYGDASYIEYKNNTAFIELYCEDIKDFEERLDEYAKLILHELLHGYEDYNRIKNGKTSLYNLIDVDYNRAVRGLNSLSAVKRNFNRCKYFLNAQERNAYFSSLEDDIIKLLKTNNYSLDKFNYSQFKEDLKSTATWELYYELYSFINKVENLSDENKQKITEMYNDIYKSKKTFNQIIKELNTKWRKFESKFNQLVPKILCNNLQIKESKEFSFFTDKLNRSFEL